MNTSERAQSNAITNLLNETFLSLESVIPIGQTRMKPQLLEGNFRIKYGVLIGMTGDIKGKLVLSGDQSVFSGIGQNMYGMPLEGEMLLSFSGELGNMVAGGLSTNIGRRGIDVAITTPTTMEGDTALSGFKRGFRVTISFAQIEEMDIILLLD